jgi:hypothetical protein
MIREQVILCPDMLSEASDVIGRKHFAETIGPF